jgi:hypothetical protein
MRRDGPADGEHVENVDVLVDFGEVEYVTQGLVVVRVGVGAECGVEGAAGGGERGEVRGEGSGDGEKEEQGEECV